MRARSAPPDPGARPEPLLGRLCRALAVGLLAYRRGAPSRGSTAGRRRRRACCSRSRTRSGRRRSSPRSTRCTWRWSAPACSRCTPTRSGRRPARLALFFAVYAVSFGNHLSMILLLVPFAVFLLLAHPRAPRSLLRQPIVGLAVAIAVAGALQYWPQLRVGAGQSLDAPAGWAPTGSRRSGST